MNSFASFQKAFYEITGGGGGRFLWESVPFHMEELFTRSGTDAGRQILPLNLLWFIHKALRGVEDGIVCGPVKSPSTPNPNHVCGDHALCAEAAMLEQKRVFLELLRQSWEHERA